MRKRKFFLLLLYTTFFLIGIAMRCKAIFLNGNLQNGLQDVFDASKIPLGKALFFIGPYYPTCSSDADCYCYEKCDLSTHTCYDFRPQLIGTCAYYDYCPSSASCPGGVSCTTGIERSCCNADLSLCTDSNYLCHGWFSC
jgi:hypothetical protein